MLADATILRLPRIKLEHKESLPVCSAIYYVVDEYEAIWYIGRSINLQKRWNSEQPHHRYEQLSSISQDKKIALFIYYAETAKQKLNQKEKRQIAKYQPHLNFTPVVKINRTSVEHTEFTDNRSLIIFSAKANNKRLSKKQMSEIKQKEQKSGLKTFTRKFIKLEDEDINLNFELELCVNLKGLFFVRHYSYCALKYGSINILEPEKPDAIKNWLNNLTSNLSVLYKYSTKWLGYQLTCEKVLLVDEAEQLEFSSFEIMMPFNMFVDLVEYEWSGKSDLNEVLKNKEREWFKTTYLSLKIAKWLHDNRLNLVELAEQIEECE